MFAFIFSLSSLINVINLNKKLMTNLEIIKQLLNGNHLEPKELELAKKILANLQLELQSRIN